MKHRNFYKKFCKHVIVKKKVIDILMDFDKFSKIIKSSVTCNIFCSIDHGPH